jgi:uncharacterized protein
MYNGPIIDCDVHHTWGSNDEILAYMSGGWQTYLRDSGIAVSPVSMNFPHTHGNNKRLDSFGPDGSPPGSDYETLKTQHLDRFDVEAAFLTYDIGHEPSHPNPFLSVEVARASNDWTIDRWLDDGHDDRLYGTIMTPTQLPEEAAKEVRRVGPHAHMAEVLLCANGLGVPFGHPVYHPIYEAAAELGLPVAIHLGGETHRSTHAAGGGLPNSRLEFHTLGSQPLVHYLVSFITYGVFEKFRDLKIVIVEGGVTWLPWIMWRLDSVYDELRRESSWVRRPPSEYLRERVSLTTQPLEMSTKRGELIELLEAVGGVENMLLFASDYPHWDADDPTYLMKRLPDAWHEKVLHENARKLYGLPTRSRSGEEVVSFGS